MPMPQTSAVHISAALSNVSVQYRNADFVAQRILPLVTVAKPADQIFLYKKGDVFRRQSTLVGLTTKVQEDYYSMDTPISYQVKYHALKGFVPYQLQRAADSPLNPKMDEAEFLTSKILLDIEIETADLVFASGTYAASNKATPTTKWGDASSSPLTDIRTAINAFVGVPGPYTMAIGAAAWEVLSRHPDVLAAFQLSVGGGVEATTAQMASWFKLDEIIVCDPWVNSGVRGGTDSFGRIWSDHCLIFKRETGLTVRSAGLGFTLQFEPFKVIEWEDLDVGPDGGTAVKPSMSCVPKVLAADAGYLIYDVVA